jgi:hypothetical protein
VGPTAGLDAGTRRKIPSLRRDSNPGNTPRRLVLTDVASKSEGGCNTNIFDKRSFWGTDICHDTE